MSSLLRRLVTRSGKYVRDTPTQDINRTFWLAFDIPAKHAIFFHPSGLTKIKTTTHLQCGRAVSALLSLPILPATPSTPSSTPTLSRYFSKPLPISSFYISQRDMLDSLHRILGTTDADWTIYYADPTQRYHEGLELLAGGGPDARLGFLRALYARIFMPGAAFGSAEEVVNEELGLPREDLDEATRRAVDIVLGREGKGEE